MSDVDQAAVVVAWTGGSYGRGAEDLPWDLLLERYLPSWHLSC